MLTYLVLAGVIVAVVAVARSFGGSSGGWHPVPIESVTTDTTRPSLEDFAKLAVGQYAVVFLDKDGIPIAANIRVLSQETPGGVLHLGGAYDSVFAWSKTKGHPSDTPHKGENFTFPGSYVFAILDEPSVATGGEGK
jgi:hypothetical protein